MSVSGRPGPAAVADRDRLLQQAQQLRQYTARVLEQLESDDREVVGAAVAGVFTAGELIADYVRQAQAVLGRDDLDEFTRAAWRRARCGVVALLPAAVRADDELTAVG